MEKVKYQLLGSRSERLKVNGEDKIVSKDDGPMDIDFNRKAQRLYENGRLQRIVIEDSEEDEETNEIEQEEPETTEDSDLKKEEQQDESETNGTIFELDLAESILERLLSSGVEEVGTLQEMEDEEIESIDQIGPKSVEEIRGSIEDWIE